MLAANHSYVMKEQLKALWTAPSAWEGWRAWTQWMSQFARLRRYWRSFVSRVRWPIHTGQLEGINNKSKVIKRMAYGYHDSDYFLLKIKAAFPGSA